MNTIIIVGIIIILIGIWIYRNEKKAKERLEIRLKEDWGRQRTQEYSTEEISEIAKYARSKRGVQDVDDITWNDLEMDVIFGRMDHTLTTIGSEYLYALLRKPEMQEKNLLERERLSIFFHKNKEDRLKLQIQMAEIGKRKNFSVFGYLSQIGDLKEESAFFHIVQFLALIVSVALCFVFPAQMILIAIAIAVFNMVTYYQRKAQMENYYLLFAYMVRIVNFSKQVAALNIPELDCYFEVLKKKAELFRHFKRQSWLVVGGNDMSGSILDSAMDYIRLLTHIDIIKFISMTKDAISLEGELLELYETIGFLDAMLSVASYRESLDGYCVPKLDFFAEGGHQLEIENVYHPLIAQPVKNSISTKKNILLTGSNASGKSTFIKTMAINAIFAQTIHTVLADGYQATFFRVYSSMALRDDIRNQESYYIVEIRSLKRILDAANEEGAPVLCFVDEVLRGTNTLERIASSAEILRKLSQKNACCFAATHDLELTQMLEEDYENYHFEEQVKEKDVIFDYRLRKGRAMTRNAIKLLNMIGYDEDIIEKAEKNVQRFLETGKW